MPSLFGSCEDFQRWFGVESHLQEEEVLLLVTSRLHQILRPFMLRRLKETVASELPTKVSPYHFLWQDTLYAQPGMITRNLGGQFHTGMIAVILFSATHSLHIIKM